MRNGQGDVADLLRIADDVLAARVAWPLARSVWRARIGKAAQAFTTFPCPPRGSRSSGNLGGRACRGQNFTLTASPTGSTFCRTGGFC